jgi:hypothetical protein
MKRIVTTIFFISLLFSVSCNTQLMEEKGNTLSDITLKVESSSPVGETQDTRSSYPSNFQGRITDFTIFVFDRNGNAVSANYYPGDMNMSGRALFVNESLHTTINDSFEVYIIANLGDLSHNNALCTGGNPVPAKVKNYVYEFSSNYSEFSSKGFPMAGFYDNYRPAADSRTLYADKLVTQYNIRFIKSSRNPNTYTITGGRLCNVAGRCTPFQLFKATSESDVNSSGDSFSASDITTLNAGNYATLFVLENEKGEVFPSSVNSENLRKMESFPSSSINRKTCTYAEFNVTVQTPTARYENVTYRYFFGDGLRDCNVHRNMVYTLTMNFDNIYVEDEGWRIEPSEPVIDDNALTLSRSQLSIIKGMSNILKVTRKAGVEYEMTYSQADARTYGLTISKTTSGNVDTYSISTSFTQSHSGTSISKVDYADIPVTFTTTDGLLTKHFNIRINKNPLLLEFSFPDGLGSAAMSNTVDWPSGTTLETSVTGILYGENQYCSNRFLGQYNCDIWQSALDVYSASNSLGEGDAASTEFQTINLRTGGLQAATHELNKSHPVDHHYAVGSTEVHYTAVGHAYLKVYYAVKINGSVAAVPIKIIARGGSSGNGSAYRLDEDGSSTNMTVKAQRVPAWYYEPTVTNNNAADDYRNGYETVNKEYRVSLLDYVMIVNGVHTGYTKGNLHSFNVEGGAMNSYNPPLGMDLIYGLPDFVSY